MGGHGVVGLENLCLVLLWFCLRVYDAATLCARAALPSLPRGGRGDKEAWI